MNEPKKHIMEDGIVHTNSDYQHLVSDISQLWCQAIVVSSQGKRLYCCKYGVADVKLANR